MLFDGRIRAVMGANVQRGDVRADVRKLKIAVLAPLEELHHRTAVGFARVLTGDLCEKELHELPPSLFAGGLDDWRKLEAAVGEFLLAVLVVGFGDFGAHKRWAIGRT